MPPLTWAPGTASSRMQRAMSDRPVVKDQFCVEKVRAKCREAEHDVTTNTSVCAVDGEEQSSCGCLWNEVESRAGAHAWGTRFWFFFPHGPKW